MKKRITLNLKTKPSTKLRMKVSTKVIIAVASLSFIVILAGAIFFFNVADVRLAFAASKNTTQSGNWDDPATWGGAVPTTSDVVTVNHTITMRGDCFADKVIVSASGILQDDGTAHILTIDGTSGSDLSVTGTLNASNTTIKFNRSNQIDGAGTFNISKINMNGKNITLQNTCTGIINLTGAPNPFLNPGTLSPGSASTISYSGTVAQVVSSNSGIKFRNLVINNSAGVTLQKKITTSNLIGNLEVQSGTLYNGGFTITGNGSRTITIRNNAGMDVSGTATAFSGFGTKVIETNSTVDYSGANQNVATGNYGNLTISGSGIKTMQGNISADQLLLMEAGYLDLNANTLIINSSSPSAINRSSGGIISENTSVASKVQWNVGTAVDSYLFPFVTATGSYIPFTFLVTTAGVGSGNITLATYSTPTNNLPYPPGVTNINSGSTNNSPNTVDRFWQIDANSYTTKPVATITFTATSAEVGTITALKAQRWNGTSWDDPLPNQIVASNTVTVPNVSMFSPWAESGNGSSLPIKLATFNAKYNNKTVEVSWITSTEVNNDYFTIERSLTGKTFTKIGTVKGAGNSKENKNYSLTDEEPLYGTSYYRLKQTDFDGKTEYFPVVAVKAATNKAVNSTITDLSINYIAPNPFQNHFTISYSINNGGKVGIQLFSINGQLVHQEEVSANSGLNQYEFNENVSLETGIYILKIAANENVISKKIIKN